jgi:hypothetical protein
MSAERWAAALARLQAEAAVAGLTAEITSTDGFDCTVRFERDGRTWTPDGVVDIAVFEDVPSPKLEALIARASREIERAS